METFDRHTCELSVHSPFTPRLPPTPLSYRADKVKLVPGTPGGPLDATSVHKDGKKLSLTYGRYYIFHLDLLMKS